jgi:hypothetical protein
LLRALHKKTFNKARKGHKQIYFAGGGGVPGSRLIGAATHNNNTNLTWKSDMYRNRCRSTPKDRFCEQFAVCTFGHL